MKPVASGPGPAVSLGQAVDRLPRRWPIATMSVLAVTVVVTVLQFPFPAVRLALWRDPDALAAGQWWRLVTAPQIARGASLPASSAIAAVHTSPRYGASAASSHSQTRSAPQPASWRSPSCSALSVSQTASTPAPSAFAQRRASPQPHTHALPPSRTLDARCCRRPGQRALAHHVCARGCTDFQILSTT